MGVFVYVFWLAASRKLAKVRAPHKSPGEVMSLGVGELIDRLKQASVLLNLCHCQLARRALNDEGISRTEQGSDW
jgi:hypothetical protein